MFWPFSESALASCLVCTIVRESALFQDHNSQLLHPKTGSLLTSQLRLLPGSFPAMNCGAADNYSKTAIPPGGRLKQDLFNLPFGKTPVGLSAGSSLLFHSNAVNGV